MTPTPAERPAALRILVGGFAVVYLLVRAQHFWQVANLPDGRWHPVGLLGWMSHAPASTFTRALLVATIAAGIAFVSGWRYRACGPSFAVLLLLLTTVRNSWGQVWHTENLLVYHVAILAVAPAAAAWSLDARRAPGARPSPDTRFAWAPQLMSVVTVATYAVAGITKLREGGFEWIFGDALQNQVAYDNVRKAALGAEYSPIAGAVLDHGWVFVPMAWATLTVELGAPLALGGGRLRSAWAAAAWAFHVGVLALMAISFPYQLSGVAYASLFPVERFGIAGLRAPRLRTWIRSPSSSAPAPTTPTSG